MLKRLLTLATDRIYNMPIVILMPHSRCNCRCIMCDIWKANQQKREIDPSLIARSVEDFRRLGVREIVLSGGEALMHSNLWRFCEALSSLQVKITLLSSGLLLERHANEIDNYIDEVIVSVDGSEAVHDRIRNIPGGFEKIARGIVALKTNNEQFPVSARSVIQRHNFSDLINTVNAAQQIGLDRISFLAADISTDAFNRTAPWTDERVHEIALSRDESLEFETIVEASFETLADAYRKGFIAETPPKMRRLVQYYKALNGLGDFPEPVCNAPWVAGVVESDGAVKPCFFHEPYGSIHDNAFGEVINSPAAISFRRNLDVRTNEICRKCVCSLKLGLTAMT